MYVIQNFVYFAYSQEFVCHTTCSLIYYIKSYFPFLRGDEEMKNKVIQLEVVELADGYIQVYRKFGDYHNKLTVEVRDERNYLKATTYEDEEVANLFYFLKPLVQRFLQREEKYYLNIIEENSKKIKKAKEEKDPGVVMYVFNFFDKSFPGGRAHLDIKDAEAKLKEQKERLLQIREELEALKA